LRIPEPELGLVLSYSYLWHHDYRRGRAEGVKDRPCVVVLAKARLENGSTLIRVVPVTHSAPGNATSAVALPQAVKQHLGLDAAPSWVILDELNEFTWPGYDLRPIPGRLDACAYGFLPPRLFASLMTKLQAAWW
jgi:hypothetical protein